MSYGLIAIVFWGLMLLYFVIADRYNIIDHPNERSSHSEITIRGGGVIFLFAALAAVILHPDYWLPVIALFLIGIVSFIDDRITLSSKVRILVHLAAVTLVFIYLHVFSLPVYEWLLLYFIIIGTINAYNFMDGINGITGAYSLVVLAGLQYVNLRQTAFVQQDMIWLPMLACGVFLYFNFRKKAKCFAGDVGSITIALWILMLLVQLMLRSDNWSYILFLAVYGADSVLTILHRIWLKQNVLKPHRYHLYQVLVNEQRLPHLWVSSAYALLQGMIIILIIHNAAFEPIGLFALTLIPLAVIYIYLKWFIVRKKVAF